MTTTVLVIDDDRDFCELLAQQIESLGYQAEFACSLKEGLTLIEQCGPEIVYLDVRLPDGNGLASIRTIMGAPGSPEVIVVTGEEEEAGVELAIRSGAWEYVVKGRSLDEIVAPLEHAIEYHREKIARCTPRALDLGRISGTSPLIRSCFDLVAQAAGSTANVLLSGETGTGKELFAWAIHANSARASQNFVVVDCTSLPENLLESMLFGHRKGAFTGAEEDRVGLVKQAHGGTLFLDEIAELPLSHQKGFLRVLQERRFRPLGGRTEETSDFRLIAASNRNLQQMVQEGTFREDLFFRICSLIIHLPPLRERTGDVREIAKNEIARICERNGIGTKGVSPGFYDALDTYSWPGNVRQLIQALDRAVAAATDYPTLYAFHLPPEIRVATATQGFTGQKSPARSKASSRDSADKEYPSLQEVRDAAVADYLRNLMMDAGGNVEMACELSGISRSRMYEVLKKYAIHTE